MRRLSWQVEAVCDEYVSYSACVSIDSQDSGTLLEVSDWASAYEVAIFEYSCCLVCTGDCGA